MIRHLAWESEFFGFDIAQLEMAGGTPDLGAVDRFLAARERALVQAIVPVDDTGLANILEGGGFGFVDLKVSYQIGVTSERTANSEFKVASSDAIPELRSVAAELFADSRFFHPIFPREKACLLFSTWVEKAVLGTFDDVCLTLMRNGRIAAFVTLRHTTGHPAVVGLVGVRKDEQLSGAGSAIMDAALAWAAAQRASALDVSTQGKNLAAQNLFISKGGRLREVGAWFYRVRRPRMKP